jgi:hypothetical protein
MSEIAIRDKLDRRDIYQIYDNVIYIVSALLSVFYALLDILRCSVLMTVLYPIDVSIKILGIMIISMIITIMRVRITRHGDYRAHDEDPRRFLAGYAKSLRLFTGPANTDRTLCWSKI